MPQVYNKNLARSMDGSAFSKNSRFMSVNQTSTETAKRLHAKLKVEKKFREHHLAIAERYKNTQLAHSERISLELTESLLRKKAYKQVVATKSFSRIKDKEERLNTNYSLYALRFDIAEQLKILDPANIREREAMRKVEKAKTDRDNVINKNLRTILSPRTRIRKRLRKQLNLDSEGTMFSTLSSTRPTPTVSRQRTTGLVVTKSFIMDKKNGNNRNNKSEEDKTSVKDSGVKLPPIKTNNNDTYKQNLTVPEKPARAPLPNIKAATRVQQLKNENQRSKTPMFKSQKPILPSINVS